MGRGHRLGQLWAPAACLGVSSVALLLVDPLLYMVGYRVLMVWVYDRTQSLPVAVVERMTRPPARFSSVPAFAGSAGVPLLTFDLGWAAVVWAVVAVVAVANGGQLTLSPLREGVAARRGMPAGCFMPAWVPLRGRRRRSRRRRLSFRAPTGRHGRNGRRRFGQASHR